MYKNVIAIFFLLCEIVSADCLLYESEAFAIEAADEYRRSCESYGGGGGVFSSSVSENTPNNTCGGYYVENAYVLRVSCNTCGSVTMQEELNANKEYCNALCKIAALSCMTPLNSWGSVLSGEATACGNDDASLPGCSESSSSESVESSSSKASSSSQEQTSSGTESSSSGGDDGESSSSEEPESSSSEDDDSSSSFEESSSSEKSSSSSMHGRYNLVYRYDGFCPNGEQFKGVYNFFFDSYGTGKHYMRKPGFFGPKKFQFGCFYNEMRIYTNIPQVFSNLDLHIECYNLETEEWRYLNVPDIPVMYTCPDVEKSSIEGCPTAKSFVNNSDERVITLYAYLYDTYYASSISDARLETTGDDYSWKEIYDNWGYNYDSSYFDRFPSNYSRTDLLNEPEFVSFFNECKRSVKAKIDFYSMIEEELGDSVWQYVIELWPPYEDISWYEDYCRSIRGENSVLYQIDSLIYEEYYDEESSQINKTYTILYYCAPPKSSSSSVEESSSSESSSSFEKSSSSEESSSSELPSSSSLSSSSEESSSSSEEIIVESSSVMPVDEPFVAGADQVYTPDQIFSSGLQNMEPGVCYSLNPDRGTIYGWNISYNASDSWWWRKVDCETGKKPVENGIGICAAFPGSKPDKVSACYAHNGSCYVCDNSKDYIDCNADWLWNYNFPTHSWFKQVDCYEPFGEDEGEFVENKQYACLVENNHATLYKSTGKASNLAKNNIKDQYEIDFSILSVNKYDVLGRNLINNNSNYKKRYSINRSLPTNREYGEIIVLENNVSSGEVDGLVELKSLKETVRVYTKGPLKGYALPDKNGNLIYYISAQIVVTILNADYGNKDPRLVSHEQEHERIFNTVNGKKFDLTISINKNLDNDKTCQKKKDAIWNAAKSEIRKMYNQQVDWDNKDTNNESKHRIDVNQAMNDVKKRFKEAYDCGCK